MKKRMLVIAAAVAATSMMMASPVMAEDFKVGICNYVDDASLNQIVASVESRLDEVGAEKGVRVTVTATSSASQIGAFLLQAQAGGGDITEEELLTTLQQQYPEP